MKTKLNPRATRAFWSQLNDSWRSEVKRHPKFSDFQTELFRKGMKETHADAELLATELPIRHEYTKPKQVSLSIEMSHSEHQSVIEYANNLSTPHDEVIVVFAKIGYDRM